jgi:hypothetical protein
MNGKRESTERSNRVSSAPKCMVGTIRPRARNRSTSPRKANPSRVRPRTASARDWAIDFHLCQGQFAGEPQSYRTTANDHNIEFVVHDLHSCTAFKPSATSEEALSQRRSAGSRLSGGCGGSRGSPFGVLASVHQPAEHQHA